METTAQKAQLDKEERSHLEDVVKDLRERAEQTVEYWIDAKLDLGSEDADVPANLSEREQELRAKVKTAIEREQAGERSWSKARDLYVKGVGYTLVNRLAALRCMEVRGFLDRSPTRFRDDGVTPAADRLITDYFLPREAGIWTAFLVACHERSEEIEILFDLRDPYSLLYGDLTGWNGEPKELAWSDDLQSSFVDLLQDLGGLLDEVDDAMWRADDVLGWVYEYYNVPDLEGVRSNVKTKEDAIAANQFYTPHWVVRMLTDNSLGKLFLEHEGILQDTIQDQEECFTPDERKARDAGAASSIEELCTYLVATEEEEGSATDFNHPSEIRVFDPACGSGHFLLYAFDVLERIWWTMETDMPRSEIPGKILQHNLYGVDLDLRACQLAAFSLYLKGRSRAEYHGCSNFSMPNLGIVCADVHGLDTQLATEVFNAVAGGDTSVRSTLSDICNQFVETPGLGSLFNPTVRIEEQFIEHGAELDSKHGSDLKALFRDFRETVEQRLNGDGFAASDLRSLGRLLTLLTQDYDVVLMNPPYGSRGRMPEEVKNYVDAYYRYNPEYYINFFEVCKRLTKKRGAIGMLVPRSFMFKKSFEDFRKDFLDGEEGKFNLLSELGIGVLDNATVRTVGTVVRVNEDEKNNKGTFLRVHDAGTQKKEETFIQAAYISNQEDKVKRRFNRDLSEFRLIPGRPMSYWVPLKLREIYDSDTVFDAENGQVDRDSLGSIRVGIQTGNDTRFTRFFWEIDMDGWVPFTSGGRDAWMIPRVTQLINWRSDGREIKRHMSSRPQNTGFYFRRGLSYTHIKESGRRFGLLVEGSIFNQTGPVFFPKNNAKEVLGFANSNMMTYMMLSQTTGRHWNVGETAKVPWYKEISSIEGLKNMVERLLELRISKRRYDFKSPYYSGSIILQMYGYENEISLYEKHKHRDKMRNISKYSAGELEAGKSIMSAKSAIYKYINKIKKEMEKIENKINRSIYKLFDLSNDLRNQVETEIAIRTNEDPRKRPEYDPDSLSEPPEDYSNLVKRMLLHLTFEVVEDDDDGIVLLRTESDEEEADLLAKVTAKFKEVWGEHAEDRLQEVDEILGNREPTDEPYPNLRHWLENDIFAFQCDEFENTPILWELTTERLGAGNGGDAGFACLIDYHQLGPDVFDRLSARYLETRKAALQERLRSARRTADSAEGEQARSARQEQQRCKRALRQIDALETKISKLTQPEPRDWAESVRDDARDLKPKVRRFRKCLEERLETLDELHEEAPSSWFKDHFSDKFMESVGGNREEWIDALEDLEAACEQFARPAEEPVEAHLYDLLPYFDDLVGSTHYSSNGIFFLNYYFSKGKDLVAKIDQGSKDRVTRREQLVADLARETDDDIELGEEINEACQEMKQHMDSEWKTRALEEVRTPGYRPVKKHGVAINITPLAEKKLVPELVEEKVL